MAEAGVAVWRRIGASRRGARGEAPVVVVGGGPVGLTVALDLGQRGHRVILLNRLDFIPAGSKAICFSKRSLEILDRLGVADPLLKRGVVWNIGKVFWGARSEPIYQFDLLPLKDQKQPAFINIQQYYVEEALIEALERLDNVELRFGHQLTGLQTDAGGITLTVADAAGEYRLRAGFLVACDGHRSTARELMRLDFSGDSFEDHFLIADIRMQGERPSERWFWFDPPFNRGQSALLHKQPDDVWRLDFQLGPKVDRSAALDPRNVEGYVRGMLGEAVRFEGVWYSLYTFRCCRMESFVRGRVIFAGDSAHLVSPFGARGCNGGLADACNLGWKLDRILNAQSPLPLLDSYDEESQLTADENIRQATRATRFMSSKTPADRALRDAVLELAAEHEFARPFVNSGRLSTAVSYPNSRLNTIDSDAWSAGPPPGSPALDAPFRGAWLSEQLGGDFVLLSHGPQRVPSGIRVVDVAGAEARLLAARYDLSAGAAYLFRPDQYVAARWKRPHEGQIGAALKRATGN